jgi:glycosyltransferase involved in cell wall biosynthesis
MPNVVLEAMASHLPVVATKSEGVAELLGHAAAPQTVAFGDSQDLTSKVLAVLRDPAMAARLGGENRSRAEEDFSLRGMVAAYERFFEQLAARLSIK